MSAVSLLANRGAPAMSRRIERVGAREAQAEAVHLNAGRDGGEIGEVGTSELPLRSQYAAWRTLMSR